MVGDYRPHLACSHLNGSYLIGRHQGRSQAIRRVGSLRTKSGPSNSIKLIITMVILKHACPS